MTQHLAVQADDFATDRFWASLNRLADSEGHEGHARFMVGQAQRLDHYEYQCSTCGVTGAQFVIDPSSRADTTSRMP